MKMTSMASIEGEAPMGGLGVAFLASGTAFGWNVAAFPGSAAALSGSVMTTEVKKAVAMGPKAVSIPS